MKIHVNEGENIIEALQQIIDYLKRDAGSCTVLQEKGLDMYFNLCSADGASSSLNEKNLFIKKDGTVEDAREHMMKLAVRICREKMLESIEYSHQKYKDAAERLERNEKKYEDAAKCSADEKTLERLQNSINVAKRHKEFIATPARNRAVLIKRCIDENKVSWSFHFTMFKKDPYEIKETFVRPMIDKECTILQKPCYFYPFAFWDDDKPVESWLKLTTVFK